MAVISIDERHEVLPQTSDVEVELRCSRTPRDVLFNVYAG